MQKSRMVVFYARISKKDVRERGKTQSIENQIQMLENYWNSSFHCGGKCQGKRKHIECFVDDGYSGRDNMRPAFRKLLGKILLGEVEVLMVKDYSRLSRDYILFGMLCQEVFPKYRIRFIAVAENFDSMKMSDDGQLFSMQLRSIFNEYYCHDISQKVRVALDAKKNQGEYAVAKPPFGYRNSQEKGRWEIEPVEAVQVQKIYDYYIDGKNINQIKKSMEEDGEKKMWDAATIWKILNNPVYQGLQVWHKYENRNYWYGKADLLPKEEWNVQIGTHSPILTEQQIQKWKELRGKKFLSSRMGEKKSPRHYFHGITKCGDCGRGLVLARRNKSLLCCNHCGKGEYKKIELSALFQYCIQEMKKVLLQNENVSSGYSDVDWSEDIPMERERWIQHFIDNIQIFGNQNVRGKESYQIEIFWKFSKK